VFALTSIKVSSKPPKLIQVFRDYDTVSWWLVPNILQKYSALQTLAVTQRNQMNYFHASWYQQRSTQLHKS
jgi:hypothetical protein